MGRNQAGSFFDAVRKVVSNAQSPAGQTAARVVGALAPRCACGELALVPMRCLLCGRTPCERHGFFNTAGVSLCLDCLDKAGIEVDLTGQGFSYGMQDDGIDSFPWADLEIAPTDDLDEIKRAFRKLATAAHPDKFSDPVERAQAQERFKRLKVAYDEAVAMATVAR